MAPEADTLYPFPGKKVWVSGPAALGSTGGEMNIAMGVILPQSLDVRFRIQAPPSLSPPAAAGIRGKGRE